MFVESIDSVLVATWPDTVIQENSRHKIKTYIFFIMFLIERKTTVTHLIHLLIRPLTVSFKYEPKQQPACQKKHDRLDACHNKVLVRDTSI